MKNTIIMTLGRTQPPHKAHINMLTKAFLGLQPDEILVHMIGSTNVDMISSGKNILSFAEREDIFLTCLQTELHEKGCTLTRLQIQEKFKCKELADQSDSTASFPSEAMRNARDDAKGQALAFFSKDKPVFYQACPAHSSWKAELRPDMEEKLYQLIQQRKASSGNNNWGEYWIRDENNNPLTKIDKDTGMPRPVYGYGVNYIAWGIIILNTLKELLPKTDDGNLSEVIYEVCGKDAGTQEYIDLLDFLATEFQQQLGFRFKLRLTEVEQLNNKTINATDIRSALLALAKENCSMEQALAKRNNNPLSTLHFLPEYSFAVAYKKISSLYKFEQLRNEQMLALSPYGLFFDDTQNTPQSASSAVPVIKSNL
ncbi:MAG: hypothetical protein ACHP65_09515 [Legionellales bacterium]